MELLNFDSPSDEALPEFKISTRPEAELFEKFLLGVHDRRLQCPGKIIFGLGNIFDVCHKFKREYGGRVFTAVVDLAISQTNCTCELDDCIKAWNRYFSGENQFGHTPQTAFLDNEMAFEGKLYYHRYLNSFVLKYRAHWDKIMGLHFLVFKYHLYNDFVRAPKKKKMFIKELGDHSLIAKEVVEYVKNDLTLFDENYRTHEAHGTGRLRKFAFTSGPEHPDNPVYDIINSKYGRYTEIAPKIFECIQFFLCLPEAMARVQKTLQS